MISIKNLTKKYRTKSLETVALKKITLDVAKGESVAIMGRSGSGKTTLLNILGCLDNADEGHYFFNKQDVAGYKDSQLAKMRNSKIGFVMQDFALINSKSVLFNASLPLFFDKTPSKEVKKLGHEVLKEMGIADQSKKKVNELSGGQRQRVAIARAIIKKPDLILADEPTGSLDTETGAEIMKLLMELNETGITLIVVTHDSMVASYCNRKVIISDGEIVEDSGSTGL